MLKQDQLQVSLFILELTILCTPFQKLLPIKQDELLPFFQTWQ